MNQSKPIFLFILPAIIVAIFGCKENDLVIPTDSWDLSGTILFQPYGPGPYQSQGVWAIDLNTPAVTLTIAYPNGYGFRVSPDYKKIVAVGPSSPSDGWGLFTVDLERILVTKILRIGRYYEWDPGWSPDGEKVVFIAEFLTNTTPRPYAICTVNRDGTSFRALTDTTQNQSPPGWPTWSPDGSKIAYIRNLQPGSPSPAFLSFISPDGSNAVDRGDAYAPFSPKWSRDGRFVAYSRLLAGAGDSNGVRVFVYDTLTSSSQQLAPTARLTPWGLNWTIDGKLVCVGNDYNRQPLEGGLSVLLCSPITLQAERILVTGGFRNASLLTSPHGMYIGILGIRSELEGYAFYVVRTDGSELRFVKTIMNYSDFSFEHHNGHWIE